MKMIEGDEIVGEHALGDAVVGDESQLVRFCEAEQSKVERHSTMIRA